MSNKKKHSESTSSSSLFNEVYQKDEQSFIDYIGDGDEAHHPPPTAKKPRLGSSEATTVIPEPEEEEPKSIDVFATTTITSQPSSQEDYGTCPEEFSDEKSPKVSSEIVVVGDSQKENSEKSTSFNDNDHKSGEIGEKSESRIDDEVDEEEEEEAELKIVSSQGSDDSDDRVIAEIEEERKMMNKGAKTSRSPSPIMFSDTDGSGEQHHHHQSSLEYKSPVKEQNDGEGEPMEVDHEHRGAQDTAENGQEENQDEDEIFGPDPNLEQEDEEELNPYERKLLQSGGTSSSSSKNIHQESPKCRVGSKTPIKPRPLSAGGAEPMDQGIPFQREVKKEEKKKEVEISIPKPRIVDKQCTTDLTFLAEQFKKRKLQFQPDFNAPNFDPEQHYRYCDIPGLKPKSKYFRHYDMINQNQWRSTDRYGNQNPNYRRQRMVLENYLRENRYAEERLDGGYQMFVYVIQDLWYNPQLNRRYEFLELKGLFNYYNQVSKAKGYLFVANQFANLVRIALTAEVVLPQKIYTFREKVRSATLSHEQCAALVARMFFSGKDGDKNGFKTILQSPSPLAVQKLHFLFAYFDKIGASCPQGCVSFRLVENESFAKRWTERRESPPSEVRIYSEMFIEETALCTQVDFANEYLGGGVLGYGSVQEEIRFLMCPEMFVGMLLMGPNSMQSTQAVSIVGAYVYSSYEGYAQTLRWLPLKDDPSRARQNHPSHRDAYGRLRVETIAIDATEFRSKNLTSQFTIANVSREIRKAAIGFMAQNENFDKIPIVTGFWGCGAFNGHKPLKFLQQVIAAGIANRPLVFCTFGEVEMTKKCEEFMAKIREKNLDLFKLNKMMRGLTIDIDKLAYTNRRYSQTLFFDYCMDIMDNIEHYDAKWEAEKARAAAAARN